MKRLNSITDKTVETYIGYLENAFMIDKSERYDIKGKKYIGTTPKYYFKDLGLRNAILSFCQTKENHLMEIVVYNEMRHRGFLVAVGNVGIRVKDEEGKLHRVTLEVDFVCNLGSAAITYSRPTVCLTTRRYSRRSVRCSRLATRSRIQRNLL